MRFILVSADDPNLQRPLDIPEELVKKKPKTRSTSKLSKSAPKKSSQEPVKGSPPEDRNPPKRAKTHQRSRVYG